MAHGPSLNWAVPESAWEHLETRVLDRYGRMDGYAGFELNRVADHWLLLEEIEDDVLDLPGGETAHTQKTNDSEVPLEEETKTRVSHRIHPETKEKLGIAASEYDVAHGVLLGYIIREYYETHGWGYSFEELEELAHTEKMDANATDPKLDRKARDPHTREEKLAVIVDRLDEETEQKNDLTYKQLSEVITEVAGPTVVDGQNGYLTEVVDRLGYVDHPHYEKSYMHPERREEVFGITKGDPAVDRKPWEKLTKRERIDAIKHHLRHRDNSLTIGEVHTDIFGGNGSRSYMRNLVQEVASGDGFEYAERWNGRKTLKAVRDPTEANGQGTAEIRTDGGRSMGVDN